MTLLIGIDGGGTKTELVLIDSTGAILATHSAPGCNPSQLGPERAQAIVVEALQTLRAKHPGGTVQRTLFCMAGSPAFWQGIAAGLRDYGAVATVNDSLPVLELATGGKPGLVLHAGTGSFVAARAPDGVIHYAGGLGWKFGDPGSGFDLGRRGLGLALLELQARAGSAPLSPLAAALCRHTGLADYAANSRFFYNDAAANAQISAFAPHLIELAAQDYGPARQVLIDSLTDLARLADGVIHRLFPHAPDKLPCGVSGRILNSDLAVATLRSLAGERHWPVELHFLNTPPIEGVRRLLLKSP